MNTDPPMSTLETALTLGIPAAYAIAAAAPTAVPRAATATFVAAVALVVLAVFTPDAHPAPGLRVDAVGGAAMLLVTFLGAVIARYSATYLDGDPCRDHHLRWLALTLTAVSTLVASDDLRVIALAWSATGVALHPLLTHFPDRPAAQLAARKKFIQSRVADLCLLGAVAWVGIEVGAFDLGAIAAWAAAHPSLSPGMHAAAALIAVAVVLRTAQFPFHGWLTSVMEAPTPVSALLHAGVVNLGGLVLVRLAPWMASAELAQALLVAAGLTSVVVGSLVATTRVSVKVALAWSTCAQMGFMLVQCGLGLWHLAMVHLVAHSLYKAHAFLSAGTTVDSWRAHALREPPPPPNLPAIVAAAAAALLIAVAASQWSGQAAGVALIVGLAVAPAVARPIPDAAARAAFAARLLGLAGLYVVFHVAGEALVDTPHAPLSATRAAMVAAATLTLFAVKTALHAAPDGALARAVYAPLANGLYADAALTRWLTPAR